MSLFFFSSAVELNFTAITKWTQRKASPSGSASIWLKNEIVAPGVRDMGEVMEWSW